LTATEGTLKTKDGRESTKRFKKCSTSAGCDACFAMAAHSHCALCDAEIQCLRICGRGGWGGGGGLKLVMGGETQRKKVAEKWSVTSAREGKRRALNMASMFLTKAAKLSSKGLCSPARV
jgi:hypothetical protein